LKVGPFHQNLLPIHQENQTGLRRHRQFHEIKKKQVRLFLLEISA
jgi:hypothetical protein